ncbi:PorT family protein [Bacteroides fragilis]|uniref:outer membrane beta-barrel protein n=1 Tax=Bacteroides TaxID=816 RepID=UPI00189874C9|nr:MULTISPECIES: outer membrane beta-barrel protein [Bacteroides]MCE8624226.1 PorT family protein [Bacteroides fragilis]MCE8700186.1 PorT family protein [Bacteroides fragilis]MCE9445750.1 PorT family protein [Bacteroides fragilis]MCS2393086.1 PorT family protein [Bacteroides fragilis]MCY6333609.1 outer membrane beta-barrel protein [Bacteroides fragilis]
MFNLNINFMKKQVAIFILLGIITIPSSVKAQKLKVSLDVGISKSILSSDVSNLVNTRYNTQTGVATGVNLEYNFFKDFIVGTGLGFIQRNYEYKKTDNITGTHTLYKNNFMNVPLNVGLYIFNNPYKENGVWLKIQGGVYYEYFTRMHRKGEYPIFAQLQKDGSYIRVQVNETYDFKRNENNLKRDLFGIEGTGEIGYSFKKIDVFASYTYQYGLTDIYKAKTSSNRKSRRISNIISLGVAYKF